MNSHELDFIIIDWREIVKWLLVIAVCCKVIIDFSHIIIRYCLSNNCNNKTICEYVSIHFCFSMTELGKVVTFNTRVVMELWKVPPDVSLGAMPDMLNFMQCPTHNHATLWRLPIIPQSLITLISYLHVYLHNIVNTIVATVNKNYITGRLQLTLY